MAFETLQNLSNDLAGAVEALDGAIVRVEGRKRMPATGVVWSEGVIVTAHHVLTRDEGLSVGLAGNRAVTAELVGRDPTTDLAALRVEAGELTVPTWAAADSLRVGQLVLALGRPGRAVQATLGVIHTLAGSWNTPMGGSVERYVSTDVTMYPGFSGGPLVGGAGTVLGVNTSGILRGMSLVLPTPTVRRVVDALLAHGHVRRGYLGIGSQAVRLPEKLAAELGQETGLLILTVEPDSPADLAGLVLGDTLVGVGEQVVRHADDLHAALHGDLIGQAVTVTVIRGGAVLRLEVVIGEHPASQG